MTDMPGRRGERLREEKPNYIAVPLVMWRKYVGPPSAHAGTDPGRGTVERTSASAVGGSPR